ncbi:MAG: TetR/AcrR family transcriptional regulator [Thermodesulfobacteriota bacterium]
MAARASRRRGAAEARDADGQPRASHGNEGDGARSTRELILDAAERLFAAHGVDGVAVRDLARETGVTASSLYNHFPSKQALYDAVLERGLEPIVAMTAEAWQAGPIRPERVRAQLERMTAHLADHRHLAPLLQRVMLEDSGLPEPRIGRWIRSLSDKGSRLIRDAAGPAGWQPEDVPHLTFALFGLLYSYFTNAQAVHAVAPWTKDPFSARALVLQRRFLEQAILRLLGPRPRRARNTKRTNA